MSAGKGIALGVAVVALIALSSSLYVVPEWEQVVITQFGKTVGDPITEAGLNFKLPFAQEVNRFEKRILIWDGERNQIPTLDKRYIWVDTTARWRVKDPLLFLQSVRNERGAQLRLDGILDAATRDVIARHKLIEVVRLGERDLPAEAEQGGTFDAHVREKITTGREKLVGMILKSARVLTPEYGIELIDVRIKRINYVESVRKQVYLRMISERQRIAEQFRSAGAGLKLALEGKRVADEKKILSEAFRDAQAAIARADAEAARTYAEAYAADPEFYAFWRTLKAYEKFVGSNTTLVISPKSDLYAYLGDIGVAPESK
ncbi:MAG: protease modulator HflC [Planctomycetota bacterium]|jgi:membrane protease subunit HflC